MELNMAVQQLFLSMLLRRIFRCLSDNECSHKCSKDNHYKLNITLGDYTLCPK